MKFNPSSLKLNFLLKLYHLCFWLSSNDKLWRNWGANVHSPLFWRNQGGFLACSVWITTSNFQFNINEDTVITTSTSCLSRLKLNGVLLTFKYISSEVLYYLYMMNFEELSLMSLIMPPRLSYGNTVHRRENELNCCFLSFEIREKGVNSKLHLPNGRHFNQGVGDYIRAWCVEALNISRLLLTHQLSKSFVVLMLLIMSLSV